MKRRHQIRTWLNVALCFLVLAMAGCAAREANPVNWKDPRLTRGWPEPPAPRRIELLRVIGGQDDLQEETGRRNFFSWLLGEEEEQHPLISPYGIAADGSGRVWVADPGSGFVTKFDLARGRLDYIGLAGNERLQVPVAVVCDIWREKLYVSDSGLRKVFVYDIEGKFQAEISPPGGFERPAGMAVGRDGRLYVIDVTRGVVFIFNQDGSYHKSIGSAASEDGVFGHPSNIAVDPSGRIYVVDSLRFRVEIQDPDGGLVKLIGQVGNAPGSFARPRGIAVDSSGHIYIADAAFDNIQIFDITGNLLLFFGGPGRDGGEFCLPAGLDIDSHDRIYVVDSCNYRFQVFQYLAGEERNIRP